MTHRELAAGGSGNYTRGMTPFRDISDHDRLPSRFFGAARGLIAGQ